MIDATSGSTVFRFRAAQESTVAADSQQAHGFDTITFNTSGGATGRSQADAPEIDGAVYLRNVPETLKAGDFVTVLVEEADAHDLFGVIA